MYVCNNVEKIDEKNTPQVMTIDYLREGDKNREQWRQILYY